MFVPIWLIFFSSGTIMAVIAVAWGVKTRQFDDQDRARFLPMAGLTMKELNEPPPIRKGAVYYSLLTIMGAGLGVMATSLIVILSLR